MKVRINWVEVDDFENLAHGVKIYYDDKTSHDDNHLVAFVDDFRWWHGTSDIADVWLLRSDSIRYTSLGIDGKTVQAQVKRAVRKYIPERKPFPHEQMSMDNKPISSNSISKHLTIWVNG